MPPKPGTGRQTVARKLKVRTGCFTCKIRKVKCDEEKPLCKRCTDTGRKCDGYASPAKNTVKDEPRTLILKDGQRPKVIVAARLIRPNPYSDTVSISSLLPGEDRQWMAFFSLRTGPALSNVFDSSFWSKILPQLANSEPAIRHALLAVGSLHARYEAESAANHNAVTMLSPDFTVRNYNQSIAKLQQNLTHGSGLAEVPLVCCLLFICLESLYGNRTLFLEHLRNGLNILQSTQFQDVRAGSFRHSLRRMFLRLDAQAMMFGKPPSSDVGGLEAIPQLQVPASFADYDEARRSLDILMASSLVFVISTYHEAFSGCSDARTAHDLQQTLQDKFFSWRDNFEILVVRLHKTADNERREKILRLQYMASLTWLSGCLAADQTVYDTYINDFQNIVSWAESLTVTSAGNTPMSSLSSQLSTLSISATSTFALDMSLIPPLFLTAIKCRDPIIRRTAISLIEKTSGREGLWDAKLHSRVARRVVEIEEGSMLLLAGAKNAVMDSGPTMQMLADGKPAELIGPPHGRFRVRRQDIFKEDEGSEKSCRVQFYTAPEGVLGEWVIWEEVLYF